MTSEMIYTSTFNRAKGIFEMGSSTWDAGLGDVMGKMDATRQCVALELKLQVLKSSSSNDFATKTTVTIKGTGARKTVL